MIKMGLLRPKTPPKAPVLEGVEHVPDCRVLGEWNERDVRFV